MRHAIVVVGSREQLAQPLPDLVLRHNEPVHISSWFANWRGQPESRLLDDVGSIIIRLVLAPFLAYRFYTLVHNTKTWSGKRPLLLIRDRRLTSRITAYAGTWGGGDVVKADLKEMAALGPVRFVLAADGRLTLLGGGEA